MATLAELQIELAEYEEALKQIALGQVVRSITHDGRNVIYQRGDMPSLRYLIRKTQASIDSLNGVHTGGRARYAAWYR